MQVLAVLADNLSDEREKSGAPASFEDVYQAWFDEVSRWVRAMGGLHSDVEDIAQEVFIVVQRKLPRFDGQNLAGWLYRITQRTVSDQRRRSWFRHLLRRRECRLEHVTAGGATPAETLERKEAERVLDEFLRRMSPKRRRAFVLFEVEGYSGEEIARLEDVPVATVWTRLHYARREFLSYVKHLKVEA